MGLRRKVLFILVVSGESLNIELRSCFSSLRCVEMSHSFLPRTDEYAQMIIGTTTRESIASCTPSASLLSGPEPTTHVSETLSFRGGQYLMGELQTASALCVDGHPVFALSHLSYYTENETAFMNSFFITPTRLIMTDDTRVPPNICDPESLPMEYTRNLVQGRDWSFRMTVAFNQESPRVASAPYRLDTTSRYTTIVVDDFNHFLELIRAETGIAVEETVHGNFFALHCHESLSRFPTLSLVTFTGDTFPISGLQVYPEDYMTEDCELTIRPARADERVLTLGDNVLRHFAIHLDISRNVIGLCDPL